MPDDLLGDLDAASPEQTGARLRKFLARRIVLDKRMNQPTAEARDQLAFCLLHYRRLHQLPPAVSQSSKSIHTMRRRFLAALDKLDKEMPAIQHERLDWLNNVVLPNPLMTGEDAKSDLSALDDLVAAVVAVRKRSFLHSKPFIPENWHDFAAELAEEFRKAMHSTNPGLPLPPSNKGPVTRFLAAVIPYLTGETPTQVAVARYLQDRGGRRG